eukprot:618698-Pleurochrysis_carterae.AAC.1
MFEDGHLHRPRQWPIKAASCSNIMRETAARRAGSDPREKPSLASPVRRQHSHDDRQTRRGALKADQRGPAQVRRAPGGRPSHGAQRRCPPAGSLESPAHASGGGRVRKWTVSCTGATLRDPVARPAYRPVQRTFRTIADRTWRLMAFDIPTALRNSSDPQKDGDLPSFTASSSQLAWLGEGYEDAKNIGPALGFVCGGSKPLRSAPCQSPD